MQMAEAVEHTTSSSVPELQEDQLASAEGGSGDCAGVDDPFSCGICKKRFQQPRVLNCLHVYCSSCLERLVEDKEGVGGGDAAASETGVGNICKVA